MTFQTFALHIYTIFLTIIVVPLLKFLHFTVLISALQLLRLPSTVRWHLWSLQDYTVRVICLLPRRKTSYLAH